ncbi:MAG: PhnD/SsuA/transferrin family substrate-binding protein [Granulosicoccus sp.]
MSHSFLLRPVAIATLLSVALLTTQLHAGESVRLNFGVYSSNKPSAMVRIFKPTLQELESRMADKLGREVDIRMQIARDYDKGVSDLTTGKVDFSRFGPASYTEAKRVNDGLRILAMENYKNSKVFYGIIAVNAESDIYTVEQLRGKSFAFGSESSTIGRFLSQLYLEKHGIHADDLSSYKYLGRHDRVGTAVGAGDFDAGALNEKTFKKLVEAGEPIRELVRFPNVTKPWIARADLAPEIYEALRDSLLEINNTAALVGLKVDGFLPGDDSDYEEIRNSIANNNAFFAEPENRDDIPAQARDNLSVSAQTDATQATAVSSNTSGFAAITSAPALQAAQGVSEVLNDGSHITVNITLPPSLFVKTDALGNNGRNITINLVIPDTNVTVALPANDTDSH